MVEFKQVGLNELLQVNLRASDLLELQATCGLSQQEALEASVDASIWWSAAVLDGQIIAAFGVAEMPGELAGIGIPWFLATEEANKHHVHVFRAAKRFLDKMHEHFPVLVQRIDARHKKALQWVGWLGFNVIHTTCEGLTGELLIQVARTKTTTKTKELQCANQFP